VFIVARQYEVGDVDPQRLGGAQPGGGDDAEQDPIPEIAFGWRRVDPVAQGTAVVV